MKPRVCAVSYLNTTPLVWGLLHGPQRELLDLRFAVPSRCAELLKSGEVDIGLVPAIELERQALEIIPGLGIASDGPVRSILLVSKVPIGSVSVLAADSSSRTSVVLSQILLRGRHNARPRVISARPELGQMLAEADAGLVIGDPALVVAGKHDAGQYADLSFWDLGSDWTEWTGLPMVYAVWAARKGFDWQGAAEVLSASWEYGRARIDEIAEREADGREVSAEVARDYLSRNIQFRLGERAFAGLERFRRHAREEGLV